jgi:hypothetical protein
MLALAAYAEGDYMEMKIVHQGYQETKYIKSSFENKNSVEYDGWQVNVPHNSMVVIKDEPECGLGSAY